MKIWEIFIGNAVWMITDQIWQLTNFCSWETLTEKSSFCARAQSFDSHTNIISPYVCRTILLEQTVLSVFLVKEQIKN